MSDQSRVIHVENIIQLTQWRLTPDGWEVEEEKEEEEEEEEEEIKGRGARRGGRSPVIKNEDEEEMQTIKTVQ